MVKLMEVPKCIFRQEGPCKDVYKLMNKFFVNTKKYLEERVEENPLIEIKNAFLNERIGAVTGDKISYVKYQEKYIVAGMLETKTALNDLQFTFFRDLSCLEKRKGEFL